MNASQDFQDIARIVVKSYIYKRPILCFDNEAAKTIDLLAKSMGIELQKIVLERDNPTQYPI